MIKVADLLGRPAFVNPGLILRFRASYGPAEPVDCTMIELEGKQIFVQTEVSVLAAEAAKAIAIVPLTTPNDLPIWVAARRILEVRPPNRDRHNPRARSVVAIQRSGKTIDQQVTETVDQVVGAISGSA